MVAFPEELLALITYLKKLPGVGRRSAERFAFHLLDWKEDEKKTFAQLIHEIDKNITYCLECGCILQKNLCFFCDNTQKRNPEILCIVSSPKEVFAIEETRAFCGLYHVIGPLLSPLDGKMPEHLHLHKLHERIKKHAITEIILAFDSTLEGDTTALFLKEELKSMEVKISRLALGMPMGSSLDYLDENTLAFAFKGRQSV